MITGDGSQVDLDREQQDKQQPRKKDRCRYQHRRADLKGVTEPCAAVQRGRNAQWQRQPNGHDNGRNRQPQRDRQPLAHNRQHRLPRTDRNTEVAAHQVGDVAPELTRNRSVDPQQLTVGEHILLPRLIPQQDHRRIAGNQPDQQEGEDHQQEGDEERLRQPPQYRMPEQAQRPCANTAG